MSKAWYYEMMGSELGPVSGAELIEKAKRGQIQPDTRVRSGKDGKWQFAERVRGLFPAPPPVVDTPPAKPIPPTTAAPRSIPLADVSENADRTYHFQGESSAPVRSTEESSEATEYEFFEFIGFRQAISSKLYDALLAYSQSSHLSVTQITRRALAEFLKRPELAEDRPQEPTTTKTSSAPEATNSLD